jgi:hypothetical protein
MENAQIYIIKLAKKMSSGKQQRCGISGKTYCLAPKI